MDYAFGPALGALFSVATVRAIAASRRPTNAQPLPVPARPAHDRTLLRKLRLGHAVELVSATVDRAPAGSPAWCWRLRVAFGPLPGTSGEAEERTLIVYSDSSGPTSSPAVVLLEALQFSQWGTVEPLR